MHATRAWWIKEGRYVTIDDGRTHSVVEVDAEELFVDEGATLDASVVDVA